MLVDLLHATVSPRPAPLTLCELLREPWRARPTFIDSYVDVHLVHADRVTFEADPRIASVLIQAQIAAVVAAGVHKPFASLTEVDGAVVLSVGLVDDIGNETIERAKLAIVPMLPGASAVLAALAAHADIRVCDGSDDGLVRTRLSAA